MFYIPVFVLSLWNLMCILHIEFVQTYHISGTQEPQVTKGYCIG